MSHKIFDKSLYLTIRRLYEMFGGVDGGTDTERAACRGQVGLNDE